MLNAIDHYNILRLVLGLVSHSQNLNLKHSKTDQERKDMKIIIGKIGDDLCPILAILSFLKVGGSYCSVGSQKHPYQIKICG